MRDELLALLEDGAHSAAQLAEWLEQPRMTVVKTLNALEDDGAVKRIGVLKHWALTTYRPRLGRLPKRAVVAAAPAPLVDAQDGLRTLDEATTIAILAAHGPQRIVDLAALLNVNQWTLRDRLGWWRTSGTIVLTRCGRKAAIVSLPGAEPAPPPIIERRRAGRPFTPPAAPVPPSSAPEPDGHVDEAATAEAARRVSDVTAARAALPTEPARAVRIIDGQEYEITWNGCGPLTAWPEDARGSSSLGGQTFGVKR